MRGCGPTRQAAATYRCGRWTFGHLSLLSQVGHSGTMGVVDTAGDGRGVGCALARWHPHSQLDGLQSGRPADLIGHRVT